MSGQRIVEMKSRAAYCEAMLARLEANQGFHTVPAVYGLANALRILPGSVWADVLLTMQVIFMKADNEGFIAGVDEVRLVKDSIAFDLVLGPLAPFYNTGIPESTPLRRSGVSMLYGIKHRYLAYRPRKRENDIGYFVPQQLPSFR